MRLLNMSYATYYRYKAKVLAATQQHIAARRSEHIEQERIEALYRKLQETIDNPNTKEKERIEALKEQHALTIDIAKLQAELPKILLQHALHLPAQVKDEGKDKDSADSSQNSSE